MITRGISKSLHRWKRTFLMRGSPAYTSSVWIVGIGGGLLWIALSEWKNPKDAKLFVNPRRKIEVTDEDVLRWNSTIVKGRPLLQPDSLHEPSQSQKQELNHDSLEERREKLLKSIKESN